MRGRCVLGLLALVVLIGCAFWVSVPFQPAIGTVRHVQELPDKLFRRTRVGSPPNPDVEMTDLKGSVKNGLVRTLPKENWKTPDTPEVRERKRRLCIEMGVQCIGKLDHSTIPVRDQPVIPENYYPTDQGYVHFRVPTLRALPEELRLAATELRLPLGQGDEGFGSWKTQAWYRRPRPPHDPGSRKPPEKGPAVTDGFFNNIYSPQYRTIISLVNHEPVAHGVNQQGLSLRSTSDIWFLDWKHFNDIESHAIADLKTVMFQQPWHHDTYTILQDLCGFNMATNCGIWPGREFSVPIALAVMGTAEGVSVAKLLAQRKVHFGNLRHVTEIRIWTTLHGEPFGRDEAETVSFLFELDDAPSALVEQQKTELSSGVQHVPMESPTFDPYDQGDLAIHDLPSAHNSPFADDGFFENRGYPHETGPRRGLWEMSKANGAKASALFLANTIPDTMKSPFPENANPLAYGYRHTFTRAWLPGFIMPAAEALRSSRCINRPDPNKADWFRMHWTHVASNSPEGIRHPATDARYDNFYDLNIGLIIVMDETNPINNAEHHPQRAQTPSDALYQPGSRQDIDYTKVAHRLELPHLEHAPRKHLADHEIVPLRQNSDLLFFGWGLLSMKRFHQIEAISHVMYGIRDSTTDEIIQWILDKHHPDGTSTRSSAPENLPDWPGLTIHPASDDGLAILGSQNGMNVVKLLIQHKATFGAHRYIKSIQIWAGIDEDGDDVTCMLFSISDPGEHMPLTRDWARLHLAAQHGGVLQEGAVSGHAKIQSAEGREHLHGGATVPVSHHQAGQGPAIPQRLPGAVEGQGRPGRAGPQEGRWRPYA